MINIQFYRIINKYEVSVDECYPFIYQYGNYILSYSVNPC